jgi:hypothetical protein
MLLLCIILAAVVAVRGKARVIVNVFTGKEQEDEEDGETSPTELSTVNNNNRGSTDSVEYHGESKMELIPPDPQKKNYQSLESVKNSSSNNPSKEYSAFPNRNSEAEKWSWDIDYNGESLWQLHNQY